MRCKMCPHLTSIIGGINLFNILLNAIKIAFLLGFLIFIHELGHFLIAKLFKIRVKEFAIGFGPTILKKQGKETKYVLRAIPLGGFVNLLGEAEESNEEGSYSKAARWKKILILLARWKRKYNIWSNDLFYINHIKW